jgi:hypothetical protein
MEDIKLSDEMKDKIVAEMVEHILTSGLPYTVQNQIQEQFLAAMAESGIIEEIVTAILERVISDKEMIVDTVGKAMVDGVAEVLAGAYKNTAQLINRKLRDTRF